MKLLKKKSNNRPMLYNDINAIHQYMGIKTTNSSYN